MLFKLLIFFKKLDLTTVYIVYRYAHRMIGLIGYYKYYVQILPNHQTIGFHSRHNITRSLHKSRNHKI